MAKSSRHNGPCVYCGGHFDSLTVEHVIPTSFFATAPQQHLKVSACEACNVEKSKYDNVLRNLLVADVRTATHSEAQQLQDKSVRAFPTMPAQVRDSLLTAERSDLYTLDGLYAGRYPAILLDKATESGFRFMVKGMYYAATGKVFPPGYRMRVTNDPEWINQLDLTTRSPRGKYYGPFVLGEDVCRYVCYHALTDVASGIWLLRFYGRLYIGVITGPSSAVG